MNIFTQRNPEWHGQPLRRVMVIGDFTNLVYRHYAEGQMCEYISDFSDTVCLQSRNYQFAGQDTSTMLATTLIKEKVDGVIYISALERGTTTVNQPVVLNIMPWNPGFATATGYGGSTTVDWENYSVKVYLLDGLAIWNANARASGNPADTIEHSSYSISKGLVRDGVILTGGVRHYKP
ncbi:MAG: hypothetical protein WBR29_03905 [Gammaproteobacteria bacterium]